MTKQPENNFSPKRYFIIIRFNGSFVFLSLECRISRRFVFFYFFFPFLRHRLHVAIWKKNLFQLPLIPPLVTRINKRHQQQQKSLSISFHWFLLLHSLWCLFWFFFVKRSSFVFIFFFHVRTGNHQTIYGSSFVPSLPNLTNMYICTVTSCHVYVMFADSVDESSST